MSNEDLFSPLLEKYERILKKNPNSRAFAPLAEIYRKYGMIEKALKILERGIRHNSDYLLGHLVLAKCYYDTEQYQLCYTTLRPLVGASRDNFDLQKLFADVCERLGHQEEALDTHKNLLFLNPKDVDSAASVLRLEEGLAKSTPHAFVLPGKAVFDVKRLAGVPDETAQQWDELDLANIPQEDDMSQWNEEPLSVPEDTGYHKVEQGLWELHSGLEERARRVLSRYR